MEECLSEEQVKKIFDERIFSVFVKEARIDGVFLDKEGREYYKKESVNKFKKKLRDVKAFLE